MSISGLETSNVGDILDRDEKILRSETDPIHEWNIKSELHWDLRHSGGHPHSTTPVG